MHKYMYIMNIHFKCIYSIFENIYVYYIEILSNIGLDSQKLAKTLNNRRFEKFLNIYSKKT